jgi:hypothetical protein
VARQRPEVREVVPEPLDHPRAGERLRFARALPREATSSGALSTAGAREAR